MTWSIVIRETALQ